MPDDTEITTSGETPEEGAPSDIILIGIEDEMRRSYLGYAVSTLIARALPDVRDGLKPSQRRILVAMNDLNLTPGSQHRKVAPRSAATPAATTIRTARRSFIPTLVRMAQEWNMRYVLVDGSRATSARSPGTRRPPCDTPKPACRRSPW